MKKKTVAKKKKVVTAKVTKKVTPAKKKLDGLKKKEQDIKKRLAAVTKEINTLERSLKKPKTPVKSKQPAKKTSPRTKKKVLQPSLTDMIIDIIRKKRRPLTIKEICTALIKEKKYKTRSNDFDHQIRVLMYKKQHGPFKKAGVGLFTVAKK